MEYQAYSGNGGGGDSGSGVVKKAAPKKAKAETPDLRVSGDIVLTETQYKSFHECMTKPKQPTEALKAGARLLETLGSK